MNKKIHLLHLLKNISPLYISHIFYYYIFITKPLESAINYLYANFYNKKTGLLRSFQIRLYENQRMKSTIFTFDFRREELFDCA